MLIFYKDENNVVSIGDYENSPTNTEFVSLEEMPLKSYRKLSEAQATRYNDLIAFNESANENNSNPANEKIALKKLDIDYIITGEEPVISIETHKATARGKLSQNYQNRLVLGYTDSVTGISLSGDEISFQKLQLLSHRLNNKKNAGNLDGWIQPFFDKNGTPQQLPGQECIELLDRYGDWWEGLYMQEKIKQGQINQANTKEALDEIDLDFPV